MENYEVYTVIEDRDEVFKSMISFVHNKHEYIVTLTNKSLSRFDSEMCEKDLSIENKSEDFVRITWVSSIQKILLHRQSSEYDQGLHLIDPVIFKIPENIHLKS